MPPAPRSILIVDDHEIARVTTERLIWHLGFRAILAADGEEAVGRFVLHQHEIAAALIDVMMPGIDGPATRDELRKIAPALPVVLMSGLGPKGLSDVGARLDGDPMLQKPMRVSDLREALRSAGVEC